VLRAVVDPGVLVSAIYGPGVPGDLLSSLLVREWQLVASPLLLEELSGVLHLAKFHSRFNAVDISRMLGRIMSRAELHEDPLDRPPVTSDPDDDYLVALAILTRADALVSGDKAVLAAPVLSPPIMTPREFLELLQQSWIR
jgi:uncharacterized protein